MGKNLRQKEEPKRFPIDLPIKRSSACCHIDNMDYCIRQLSGYSTQIDDPVVGYILTRGWGAREAHYTILSKENAECLKKTHPQFDYITLDDFVRKREEIEKGKYIVHNGLIVDLNPSYSH